LRWRRRLTSGGQLEFATVSIEQLKSPLRERVEAIPTRLTLSSEQVDAAFEGGRSGLPELQELHTYLKERVTSRRDKED